MKRRAFNNKRDANEPDIVNALEQAGAKVWRLDMPWDLLVQVSHGKYDLIEVKNGRAGLNPDQQERVKDWPVEILRTPEEAIRFVNSIRRLST